MNWKKLASLGVVAMMSLSGREEHLQEVGTETL